MSSIPGPFRRAAFELASYNLVGEVNERKLREVPRASGLGGCAREHGYYMADLDPDHPIGGGASDEPQPPRPGGRLTAESGRYIEKLIIDTIEVLPPDPPSRPTPLAVVASQAELPADALCSGHPDGELRQITKGGNVSSVRTLADGLVWGLEFKLKGYFAYGKIAERGLFEAEPVYASQVLLYGHYLGWDAVQVIILAADGRATGRFAAKALKTGLERGADLSEKSHIIPVDLRPYYVTHLPTVLQRARELAQNRNRPEAIAREYDSKQNFPCSWCDWQNRCKVDGPGFVNVMPNSFGYIT